MNTITNEIGLALGGHSTSGIAAGVASPYINEQIKQATKDIPELNIPSHMLWGAIEAELQGGNAASGAIAAGVGEASAKYLSQALFNESNPEKLNEAQKKTLSTLSQVSAGVASGLSTVAQGSNSYNTAQATSNGIDIAKNTVENNALSLKDIYAYQRALKKALKSGGNVEDVHKYFKALSEKQRAELFVDCDISCRVSVPKELSGAIGVADELSDLLNSWVNNLPLGEQTKFYQLVESENTKTIQVLKEKQSGLEKGIELVLDASSLFSKEDGIDNSKTKRSLYNPKQVRKKVEEEFGQNNVKSTTVVKNARSTVTERQLKTGETVHISESAGGKAIQVRSKPDEFGNTKLLANIPYDPRGLPIFDDVSAFTTKIEKPKNHQNMNSVVRRHIEMKNATLALKKEIEIGRVSKNLFTKQQLKDIYSGKESINGYTWHHNAQSSPNNMQLLPTNIHEAVRHIGEASLSEGR